MATKLKNRNGLVGSIIAITLALGSLLYCASYTVDLFLDGWERVNLATHYFGRIIRGGTV
ncbi:hypothetical protein CSV71_16205 [Sporosarcina sp. P21c]|uniref:hypothetical protein n=1 Tax=Sporosarcina sp. P21c TaxID=2048255 RepID=UPI000A14A704|nr:hypothetical protein [Sporosarcina sp. P21c]ARJ39237.1 hypothetical protein SporoP8_10365 [Sporosarcina ureae]PIC66088.1 hypothetical protein CSV78_14565 [Sporosarcina sp. P16a]PIC82532.1 hypothetical protein CSV73_11950 [Sporosarcina sp. P1]PIC91689.1 hypothetical protein CSV70_14550 [Sporosarcina sp. P25]PIC87511.1 hypothetical protein CSV71_16205 [Sporosarcina sp. P21c]